MDRNVHQPRAPDARVDFGNAANRLGVEHAVPDDAQATSHLRDQHVAVRQKGKRPRMPQPLDRHDAEWLPARIREDLRSIGEGHCPDDPHPATLPSPVTTRNPAPPAVPRAPPTQAPRSG